MLSQEISTAPAVQLTSGDGDVSTTGAHLPGVILKFDCRMRYHA